MYGGSQVKKSPSSANFKGTSRQRIASGRSGRSSWLSLSRSCSSSAGALRTNLAGEKKRDFGFDDLTTLLCSECLVEWLGGHASRKTQRKDSNDSPHVCITSQIWLRGAAFGVHEVPYEFPSIGAA